MTNSSPSIQYLLARGDVIAIISGKLIITPVSGKPAPESWFKTHANRLLKDILMQAGLDGLVFDSYTTGRFSKLQFSGVSLQFNTVLLDKPAYVIFNANLDRIKTTRKGSKGSALPVGQFRVGKRSGFYAFWKESGLTIPPRLSSFHDYMGNLKSLIFTGSFTKGERLDKQTIQTLSVSHEQILQAFGMTVPPDKSQTRDIQQPDKTHTPWPDKKLLVDHAYQGLQPTPAKGETNYGTRLSGSTDARANVIPLTTPKKPQDQSVDEWLVDYGEDKLNTHLPNDLG